MNLPIPGLRSPSDLVGNLCYFGRMLDKIRLHLDGKLPESHIPSLGGGFDERCAHFLKISYRDLVDHVAAHRAAGDDELLAWTLNAGRRPDDEEVEIWNDFMRKRGWKDGASTRLAERKAQSGFTDRADIETMFQYIDADEGRF